MTMNNRFNDVEMVEMGGGVCLFPKAIDCDWNFVYETSRGLVDRDAGDMYSETVHPETGKKALINRSGYIFDYETFLSMPSRCSSAHQNCSDEFREILEFWESSKDKYLLKYMLRYPLAYKNIWWKVKGHIVRYGSFNGKSRDNQYLGIHSDTSADYVYGYSHPSDQLATRNTLSCIVYINDCEEPRTSEMAFSGGHHYFNELDIDYRPSKGDILMFPSNYIASHEVRQVTSGERYSYLGWYSHGSPNGDYNEHIADPATEPDTARVSTNVYLPNLRKDFRDYIEKCGVNKNNYAYSLVADGF